VCIFQLTFVLKKPKLVQFKPLTSKRADKLLFASFTNPFICLVNLMKAVTSTKFSPSSAFALIGFGVRHDGRVVDHPSGFVDLAFAVVVFTNTCPLNLQGYNMRDLTME
jgi:hypothetical protein